MHSSCIASEDAKDEPLLTVAQHAGEKYKLALVNLRGQIVGKVIESNQPVLEPAWSPDGTRLAYATVQEGRLQIFVVQADGSAPINVTKSDFLRRNPTWSPDGSQIAWSRFDQDVHSIWTMRPDESNAVCISEPGITSSNPCWSPDGKLIAYSTHRQGDRDFRVWQVNSDGTSPRALYNEMVIRVIYPCWSPDGNQVVFGGHGSDGRVQLCVCNANGGDFTQITRNEKQCSYASWSPDGQYIAYVAFDRWVEGYLPCGPDADLDCPPGDLMLYDTLSGERRKLLSRALPMYGPRPSWKPRRADH